MEAAIQGESLEATEVDQGLNNGQSEQNQPKSDTAQQVFSDQQPAQEEQAETYSSIATPLKQSGLKHRQSNAETVQQGMGQIVNLSQGSERSQEEEGVQTQMFDSVKDYNASLRCDEKFRVLMPGGEISRSDGQWLKREDGQRLLASMQAIGVDLLLWWDFLDYWHKQHHLWAWKGQDGFSGKTNEERRVAIKRAFSGWLRKADNEIALEDDLGCFKSGLRRAEDSQRTEQYRQKKDMTPRRRLTKEEADILIAKLDEGVPTIRLGHRAKQIPSFYL